MGGEEWMDNKGSTPTEPSTREENGHLLFIQQQDAVKGGEKNKNACSGQVQAGLRFKRYTLLLKKALFYELLTFFTFEDFTLNKQRIQGEGGKAEENLRCKDANRVVEETEEDVGGEE
ncbi:hypothetical protein CISG_01713 [Coccidioides immitis RMSCC 3703]|uniref:Uncharacterized protein n=1 Tax=Coccidioides immitis RMSCC 3703 TaxID=454286 RepID=A0A0J8R4N7_COCIT|nr:hypothetical protein CISG_01713 [Coccidioides immitis RMSCC 3703]